MGRMLAWSAECDVWPGLVWPGLLSATSGCFIRYDGTVRNSAGDVVQFLYGEDGMDAVRIEGQVREEEKSAASALRVDKAGDSLLV